MFEFKTILITGGTGSFGTAALDRFLKTDFAEIRISVVMRRNRKIFAFGWATIESNSTLATCATMMPWTMRCRAWTMSSMPPR